MASSLLQSPAADLLGAASSRQALSGDRFAYGGEFTVGAEEELLLVDAEGRLHHGVSPGLVRALEGRLLGAASPELYGAEIEFSTAVGRHGDEVSSWLGDFRRALQRAGGRAMAVGVHPAGEFGDIGLSAAPRYLTIGASLAGLLRTPTAALQVHVGMPDPGTAVTAMRGLRHQLALLRALTCGSPYWHGHDSGLTSARWALIRSYPRHGVPPVVRSWEEYVALTDAVAAAAEVPDYTHLWWDLRAQPRLGTLEVRVMDAQPSLAVVAGLVALIQGLARYAVERPVDVDVPTEVLAENDFRVARYGLDARIVDRDGMMRPVRELAVRAVVEARAVLAPEGLDDPLAAVERLLCEEPEYDRQRRVHAAAGMAGLLRDLSERTSVTD